MAKIYALRDTKSASFRSFYSVTTEAEAIRSLAVAVCDPQSQLNMFAGDYDLYHICDIDEESASITKPEQPAFIVNGGSVKAQYVQMLHVESQPKEEKPIEERKDNHA